jgi:hypothetical protein
MHWGGIGLAGLAAAVATFLTDWFFFGVWMHAKYNLHPEVWRPADASGGNRTGIVANAVINTVACFGLVTLLSCLGLTAWGPALGFAFGVWGLAILPILIVNTLFMRISPWLLLPNGLGYLARLVICAVATVLLAA